MKPELNAVLLCHCFTIARGFSNDPGMVLAMGMILLMATLHQLSEQHCI